MNNPQRIIANSSIFLLGRIVVSLLSLLIAIVIARHLGSENYGKFSIVFAYLSFFQVLSGLSLDTIVVKEIARNDFRSEQIVGNAVIMRVFLSVLSFGISWLLLRFADYHPDVKQLIFIALLSLFFSFGTLYTSIFQAKLKTQSIIVSDILIGLFITTLVFFAAKAHAPIYVFVALQAFIVVPQLVVYIVLSANKMNFKPVYTFELQICTKLFADSWPLFFMAVCVAVNHRIDQIILFKMMDANALGLYSAVVTLTESLHIIPMAFMASMFPLLSSSYRESFPKFSTMSRKSFKYMGLIIIPIAVLTTLLAERILVLAYGKSFAAASAAFSIIIWSEVFVFQGMVLSGTVTAAGLQRFLIFAPPVGAILNIILNLILVPKYGIAGAAVATVNSYGGILIFLQLMIKPLRLYMVDYLKSLVSPLFCSIPMGIFVYSFIQWNLVFLIVVSVVIYFLTLLITRTIDDEDRGYMRQIIGIKGAYNG